MNERMASRATLAAPGRSSWRRWTRAALAYPVLVALIAGGVFCVLDARRYTPAFALAFESLAHDADLAERLGAPLEAGSVFGSFGTSPTGHEEASLSFALRGPRAEATAYVRAHEVGSIWRIERLEVELRQSRERLLITGPDDSRAQARLGAGRGAQLRAWRRP
jgi:hypothetical protein